MAEISVITDARPMGYGHSPKTPCYICGASSTSIAA